MSRNRSLTRAAPIRAAIIRDRLLAVALLSTPLLAQNAELSGLISDPAGLAVPGARVVVQSADTRGTRTVSSNQQGEYSVPALLPGPYNITIEATGFKTLIDPTAGVVLIPSKQYEGGQFSVNGQHPDANYFTVDGVSANLGSSAINLAQSGAGQLPATSAFGGTSNLV